MKDNSSLMMSFMDKSLKVSRYNNRVIASLKAGFKFTKLDDMFKKAGFNSVPDFVVDILVENGYKKNYKHGMWYVDCTGVSKCSPDDDFDLTKGRRVAVSRAKQDAYRRAMNVMLKVSAKMWTVWTTSDNTLEELLTFYENEGDAIYNVIEYGVSNPNK